MKLKSKAFDDGGRIPAKYTCDGINVSPPLEWEDIPSGAVSFALICDDPDAPSKVWTHWLIFNIPADIQSLDEAVENGERSKNGAIQGKNDSGVLGYRGPCPPGGVHRYFFKLYALDIKLDLNPGVSKEDILRDMEGHVIDQVEIIGLYSR